MSSPSTAKPELLAPAGDWECVRAAVANGADAIYFGLPRFNARLRAENFTEEDLPRLMEYLHARAVRGFVAFNTLIFTDELPAAAAQLRLLQRCGVDAAIVQDLGLVALAREVAPELEIHASTQMTLTSPEGVRLARRLGIARVVLARELSLRELAKFREENGEPILPLEVFVHGALCVAYSGQCLTSEALGQRSANRGECAQACRLPYTLVVDGKARDLGDKRYLLSPQDLAAVNEIPELVRLGVASFKIEGRLKSPEYVAAVTQVYRQAIDAACAGRTHAPSARERYALEMTFSRGQFSGWLHGVDHQQLVHARFGKKRGVLVGRVAIVGADWVELDALPDPPLAPGEGLVFDEGRDTEHEQGGRLYEIRGRRHFFGHGKIDFSRVQVGARIWKTDDPKLTAAIRASFARDRPPRRELLDLRVSGRVGEPLRVEARAHGVSVDSSVPLLLAQKRPLSAETLREQLGRLGGTRFELGKLECALESDLILPLRELNALRRDLVAQLEARAANRPVSALVSEKATWHLPARSETQTARAPRETKPHLTVLCRTLTQVEVALECPEATAIYADFEDIRRYKEAVTTFRAGNRSDSAIFLATPRIQKAGEQGFFKLIENAAPDGVLVRNLGALDYFRASSLRLVGDFSLNVANPFTARVLRSLGPLNRLTVSYDLNAEQALALVRATPDLSFEITLHQHMPLFHMEHCVFAAFMSAGRDHLTCGRPCDRHEVRVRDRVGLEHPVKADVGCRNTVFHAKAQSGAEFLTDFQAAGVRHFRVELLAENRDEARRVVQGYAHLLRRETTPAELLSRLKTTSQLGVTTGTLAILPARASL